MTDLSKTYDKTHLNTYRYRCKSVKTKDGNTIYPLNPKGNYEPLLSFKNLPKSYNDLIGKGQGIDGEDKGRKWTYTKTYEPIIDRLVLDIDCEDGLETAFQVTKDILNYFPDADHNSINIYFSGSKGFHIEILTTELNIVDTTADKPKCACKMYVEFLNYFQNMFNQVDLSLKDVGTRIFRIHHTKHEKTNNYKILINTNADLDTIIEFSKKNKDMVEPAKEYLNQERALYYLNRFSKPLKESDCEDTTKQKQINEYTEDCIYTRIYNDLITPSRHNKGFLIASALNGYVDFEKVKKIYRILKETTDIGDSNNSEQSFYDAYKNDTMPLNMGQLRNNYTENGIDLKNFNELSNILESKIQNKNYDDFIGILQAYEYDWFGMLETKLYDYVDNTDNIFIGIINGLGAELGYLRRIIVVNGGAEVGKSEFMDTLKKMMPRYENLGSSTPATIRRRSEYYFNKKIVYLGDKGLKGKEDEEFKGLQEVFGGLVTEGEFVRDVVEGDKIQEYNLKSDGLCVYYTEPYTNLKIFGAGDQYSTRSTFITVNPVKDGLSVFLNEDDTENPFYKIHQNYIKSILKNPLELKIDNTIKTIIYNASNSSLRTAKYLLGLFKAYCQYLQIDQPKKDDVESFLNTFQPKYEITQIEALVYEKLYSNLKAIENEDDLYAHQNDDGSISMDYLLLQVKGRKEKSFFTAKQIKTYFQNDFKSNKNLKDTIDQIPQILQNLFTAGLLGRLDWQYQNQNVYYINQKEEMEDNEN